MGVLQDADQMSVRQCGGAQYLELCSMYQYNKYESKHKVMYSMLPLPSIVEKCVPIRRRHSVFSYKFHAI